MALYLLLSIAGAATSSQLMVTINNLFYFGITQFLPGMLGILFLAACALGAIIAGIIAGDVVAIAIFELAIPVGGINAGFIGLLRQSGNCLRGASFLARAANACRSQRDGSNTLSRPGRNSRIAG